MVAGGRFGDVRWVRETASTNADVIEAADGGAAEGLVLVADHQTAGRGRLGRRWESAPGSGLLVSVLLRPSLPPSRLHLCTLAVALAAVDACEAIAAVRPGLKWPNDLVVGDRKLGGVLAETSAAGGRVDAVVVGVGLNVRAGGVPDELAGSAVSLEELAEGPVESGVLLVSLLRALDRRWGLVASGEGGQAALLAAARAASATLGRDVVVERPDGAVSGRAEDLDGDGHLVVVDAAGRRHAVAAGDVTHLRPLPPD
jgi:BirA family transcriptional regulator, biotin operon repressor / biotin---[acetyl-CoA-carboxylase] ligase